MKIDANTPGQHHYRILTESEHLGQWDLMARDGSGRLLEPTVIIKSVETYVPKVQRFKKTNDGRKVPERLSKLLIMFEGKRKGLIANKTIQDTIAAMYGTTLQNWIGKPVKLYVDPNVTFGKKKLGGIRVRNNAPRDEPTDDPLDNATDERLKQVLDETFGNNDDGSHNAT